MQTILIFIGIASLVGAIFLVSLVELIITSRRRKSTEALKAQLKELKVAYNEQINKIVLEDEAKLTEAEKEVKDLEAKVEEEKKEVEEEYEEKIADLTENSKKALDHAKAKAKKLEQEAQLKADEYLASRQKEVEEDLMNLVISVTKKVLPDGLTYDVQKDLVMHALRDVKVSNETPHE